MEHISPDNPRTKFELLELLGEGSYGTVHKAKIRADGTVCAVKILSMEGAENEDELQNELEILRKCVHESIVSYFGSYREAGDLWIAMEYCGTGSVRDLLDALKYYTDTDNEEGIVLDEEQIAAILVGTLRGLEYLHNSKMIHRDIKSGNVLLTEGGGCKLADFGVSAQLQKTLSKRKTLIGSPYWMAPEVIREEAYDGRADIWSVGIIAIEMAQNVPPLHDIHPMRAIFMVTKNPPPKLTDETGWSPSFLDFISACLVKDHTERPDASQLLKTHALMIAAAGGSSKGKTFSTGCVPKAGERDPTEVISDLVASSMGAITIMRQDVEDADATPESEQSVQRRTGGQQNWGGGTVDDTGTLVVTQSMGNLYSSQHQPAGIQQSVGRIIDNSTGTLVVGGVIDQIDTGDSGTLVMTPGGGARPSYMDYIRDDDKGGGNAPPVKQKSSPPIAPIAEDDAANAAVIAPSAAVIAPGMANIEINAPGLLSGVLEKKGAARWTKKDCVWRPDVRELVYCPFGADESQQKRFEVLRVYDIPDRKGCRKHRLDLAGTEVPKQSEKHTFIALSAISPEEKQRWLSGIQAVVGDETNLSLHPRAREFEKGGGTFGGTFGAGTFGGGSDAPAAPMESL